MPVTDMMVKRSRKGAQGVRKVKTGCLTCKIRHKKCDEKLPSCSPCKSTGRKCDFEEATEATIGSPLRKKQQFQSLHMFANLEQTQLHLMPLNNAVDHAHFDYFVNILTKEFSLYFESPAWEDLVIQAACTEPCIRHVALALGAMGRYEYYTDTQSRQSIQLTLDYSMTQYNMALRALNESLDGSTRSLELAILGSIVFIAFEVLWGADTRVKVHMNGAFAILDSLTGVEADYWYTRTYSQCLVNALKRLNEQITLFTGSVATIRG